MGVIGAYIFNGKYIIICDNLQQGRDLEPVGNIFEARGGQGSQPFYIISCRKIRFCNINQPKAICIFFGVAGQVISFAEQEKVDGVYVEDAKLSALSR